MPNQRYTIIIDSDVEGADQAKSAIEDVQELAERGLEELKLRGDKRAIEELQGQIKELEAVATRPKPLKLDNKKAVADAKELEQRINAITARSNKRALPFFDRLKSDLGTLKSQVPAVGKVFDALQLAATGPVAILATAVGGLTFAWRGATAALQAYRAEAPKFAELDAVLAKHNALTAETRKRYVDLASELQNATNIADDQWLSALTRITNFGADPRNIGIDATALKNLTALLKGDSTRAADLYSRALKGQFELFKELGIEIDKTASKEQKLKQLREQVAQLGDGLLEAQTKNTAGAITDLANAAGDTAEGFGRLLSRSLLVNGAVKGMAETLKALISVLPPAVVQTEGLTNKLPDLRKEMAATTEEAKKLSDEGLKRLAEQTAQGDAALSRYITRLREVARAQIAVTDAQLASDLAGVDLAVAQGDTSSEQGEQQRFALRQAATERRNQIETGVLSAERKSVAGQITEGESATQAAADELTRLLQAAVDLQQGFKFDFSNYEKLREEYTSLQREQAQLESRIDQFRQTVRTGLRASDESVAQARSDVARSNVVDARLAEIAGFGITSPETEAIVKQSQGLNDQIVAQRAVLAQLRSNWSSQQKELQAQLASLDLQLAERQKITELQQQTSIRTEQARQAEQQRAEQERAEQERISAGFPREAAQTAATAQGVFAGATVSRRPSETDRQFSARQLNVEELRRQGIEAAQALRDGATAEEVESLSAAFREFVGSVDQISREQNRVKAQLNALTRMVQQGSSQIRNAR